MRTLLLSLLLLAPALHADTVYYFVTTDHTGAQVQLDANHSSFWSFTPSVSFLLGGGKFVLKEGPATSGDTLFSVWQGAYNPTPPPDPRTSLTYSHATWRAQHPGGTGGAEQSFALTPYLLSNAATWLAPGVVLETAAYRLQAGTTYTIALTSNAGIAGSRQYFIKDPDTVGFYDEYNNRLDTPPTITYNGPTPIPEPSSWLLLAGGMGLVAVSRRYRQAR